MDLDTVLLSVQERDKWQRRLSLLEKSLTELRDQRDRLQDRLRRIKKDLLRLGRYSEALLDQTGRTPAAGRAHGSEGHFAVR